MKKNSSYQWMTERADQTVEQGSGETSLGAVGSWGDVFDSHFNMSAEEHERSDAAYVKFCEKHQLPYGWRRKDQGGMGGVFDFKKHPDPQDPDPQGSSAFVPELNPFSEFAPHPDAFLYDAEEEDVDFSTTVSPFSPDFDQMVA